MTSARQHSQRTIYNHQRSQERRQPEKQSAVQTVRAKHADENADMANKHRRESQTLHQQIDNERARNHPYQTEPANADKRRRTLREKHEGEQQAKTERQSRERTKASAADRLD
jgi:hypothetical protein